MTVDDVPQPPAANPVVTVHPDWKRDSNGPDRWRDHAACLGHPYPDWWFSHLPDEIFAAQQVCLGCPVIDACMDEAIRLGSDASHGVWAGTTPQDRVNMRRRARAEQRTHCVNGHEFTPENTRQRADGAGRVCRACHADEAKRSRARLARERAAS